MIGLLPRSPSREFDGFGRLAVDHYVVCLSEAAMAQNCAPALVAPPA